LDWGFPQPRQVERLGSEPAILASLSSTALASPSRADQSTPLELISQLSLIKT
jgi:hypothetical protein